MGSLPEARVIPSRPFFHTEVDFVGPILLRATKESQGTQGIPVNLRLFQLARRPLGSGKRLLS